jgi:hypothetical protein
MKGLIRPLRAFNALKGRYKALKSRIRPVEAL